MWSDLPPELLEVVWEHRTRSARVDRSHRAARRVQTIWRGYRTRVLCGRYRMLRYVRPFCEWNPSLGAFLSRARV